MRDVIGWPILGIQVLERLIETGESVAVAAASSPSTRPYEEHHDFRRDVE